MGSVAVRADPITLVGGVLWVALFLLSVLVFVYDPSSADLILVLIDVFLVLLIVVLILRRRVTAAAKDPLLPHRWSDPVPGFRGLFRGEAGEGVTSRARISTETEPPPICPNCAYPSSLGELNCAKCGTALWTRPAPPAVPPA